MLQHGTAACFLLSDLLSRPLARRTSTSASAHGKQGAQGEEMSMEASTERKIRSHPAACRASNLGNMGKDIFCNRELNMKQVRAGSNPSPESFLQGGSLNWDGK